VLVVGSEGQGLSKLVRDHCDELVSIPGRGRVDSYNASVASAILMYEVRRQQGFRRLDAD
jgi:23S rRNA (guanosine2251-2'-O)-methyltransferase